ncbi:unnamed protein product, partial [Ectocarpus fasciculatus]
GLAVPVICPSVSASVDLKFCPASKAFLNGFVISGSVSAILSTSSSCAPDTSSLVLPLPNRRHSPSSCGAAPSSLPSPPAVARSGPAAGAAAPRAACFRPKARSVAAVVPAAPTLRRPAGGEELFATVDPAITDGVANADALMSWPCCRQTQNSATASATLRM